MSKHIPLFGKYGQGLFAVIDDEDFDKVNQYRWHLGNNGYIKTFVGGRKHAKCILLHRLIMDPADDLEVDHRDGDKLNNCRANLRISTRNQNARNLRRHKQFSSRFKGVSWNSGDQLWDARIQVNLKTIHLGQFPSEIQAALAYNEAALQHFGEYASLNEIGESTKDNIVRRQGKAYSTARTSQYLGVNFSKTRNSWNAEATINGQRFRMRGFSTEEEAARAYDKVVLKHRGARAFLNFPEDALLPAE